MRCAYAKEITDKETLEHQQMWIMFVLVLGLCLYVVISVWLRARLIVTESSNLDFLNRTGIQLFTPYIGIGIGGFFGTRQLKDPKPDRHRFKVAIWTLGLWDALIIGFLLLVPLGWQYVEDFQDFAGTTLPILATFVAAVMAHFFGAQSGGEIPNGGTPTTGGPRAVGAEAAPQ